MTCDRQTAKDIRETVEFAKKIGAVEFDLRRTVPVGRALVKNVRPISSSHYYLLCKTAIDTGRKLGLRIELGDPFPPLLLNERLRGMARQDEELRAGVKIGGCSVGTNSVYIAPSGKVLLCPYIPIYCGDLRRDSLKKIWETSKTFKFFRSIRYNLQGKCGKCEFKFACGGCRAIVYATCGNICAEDLGCWHKPA